MTVQTEVRSLVVPVVAGAGLGVFSLLADGVIGGRRANDINDLIECYRRVRRGMGGRPVRSDGRRMSSPIHAPGLVR